ncbi:isopentenyl-diphosphate delta-isomerase [Citrobacter koseri]|uniref:Isopentenyl-diphosphate Delta-isomerase n=1 Tax=Citrobacter koseri TaxID=545 RepID=A0A2X2WQA3_CITKO|nr:isopentenyl-diphosphate delta-isomerase [Citrobacter koseri]
MTGEHVILLDEQGNPDGILEKYAAHTSDTLLHLAFSCWLFNTQGQLLVTRRSLSKKAWPGVWTNSVCGHPQQGESTEAAIIRRSRFELGVEITNLTPVYPDFRYRATDPNGIVENEVCPVYAAQVTSALQVNPDEVMDYQWERPGNRTASIERGAVGVQSVGWCCRRLTTRRVSCCGSIARVNLLALCPVALRLPGLQRCKS